MNKRPKYLPPNRITPIILGFFVLLSFLLLTVILPQHCVHDQNAGILRELNNAKGIKSALDLFASDFEGSYPNDETAKELLKIDPSSQLAKATSPPTTSNYYFNQLIGRGLDSEEIFYTQTQQKTFQLRKPNNNGIVEQGENIWGYTKNLKWNSSPHLPLIFDSSVSVGNHPSLSKRTWNGRTIIARIDSSTRTEVIASSGAEKGIIKKEINGRRINIFSPEALEGGVSLPADLKRIGSTQPTSATSP